MAAGTRNRPVARFATREADSPSLVPQAGPRPRVRAMPHRPASPAMGQRERCPAKGRQTRTGAANLDPAGGTKAPATTRRGLAGQVRSPRPKPCQDTKPEALAPHARTQPGCRGDEVGPWYNRRV